jgi:hypothetical protein
MSANKYADASGRKSQSLFYEFLAQVDEYFFCFFWAECYVSEFILRSSIS